MAANQRDSVLVIGVGNEFRNDDGVGRHVALHIGEPALPGVSVRQESGEGAALMEAWEEYSRVFVIDATSSKHPAGTIHRLDAGTNKIPSEFFHYSTHAFSLAEAVELARVLGKLPSRLVIYGIEGASFAAGTELSEIVRRSAGEVVQRIRNEITQLESTLSNT